MGTRFKTSPCARSLAVLYCSLLFRTYHNVDTPSGDVIESEAPFGNHLLSLGKVKLCRLADKLFITGERGIDEFPIIFVRSRVVQRE